MDIGLTREALIRRLYETLDANGMDEGVHIRLMVTRGIRSTPYQDPRVVVSPRDDRHHPRIQGAAAGHRSSRASAVHRPCPPRLPGRAGPQAQLPLEAQLHHRLHPGDAGRRRRGADARSARLRRHLQLDPFLHRPQGRGLDLDRRLLPRRHHPRQRHPALPRGRHPGVREEFLADRRLWRRGGVRHRHLRRRRPGARDRRAPPSPTAAGRWSSGCSSSIGERSRTRRGGAAQRP